MAGSPLNTYVLDRDYHGPAYDDGHTPLTRGDRVRLGEDHLLVRIGIAVPAGATAAAPAAASPSVSAETPGSGPSPKKK